jgi:putative phosphoribosyl transferase
MLFADRFEAGLLLASKLGEFRNRDDVVVLALPRGGVPVGYEVANAVHAPLDVFVVRKLGVPGQEELAMGALASGGIILVNRDVVEALGISQQTIDATVALNQEGFLASAKRAWGIVRKSFRISGGCGTAVISSIQCRM